MPTSNTGRPSSPLPRAEPPMDLPRGYVGPARLPGSGRLIFWTGRVAIGLRHPASGVAVPEGNTPN